MTAIEIQPDVYWINVNDGTTDLFEDLWSIPLNLRAVQPETILKRRGIREEVR